MKRTNLLSLALAAALLGAMSPAAANAQAPEAGRFRGQSGDNKWWDPQAQGQDQRGLRSANFEGRWVAQSRDDSRFGDGNGNGSYGRGDRNGNGAYGRGDGNGAYGRGDGNGAFGGGAGRGTTLPDFLRIDQQRRLVRITDRGNHMVQVIALDRGYRDREGVAFLSGQLNGNRLVAQGVDARGRQMTQTMFLRDRGQTLVVRTQVERGRSGRVVETEKVYQRA